MIAIDQLTKRYRDVVAVDDVSFEARPGRVTGFLGPNGAGKTTVMRVLCGLTPATGGQARVLGLDYHRLSNPGRQIGVLLDASAQHAGRTGREVLTLGVILLGLPRARVDEMLDLVGLTDAEAARRTRDYSLGMRQRLGIAHALLGDPQVLVLDEPANGLDPHGIHWMRGLLREFADQGGTVLLSSHLLAEVEAVADDLVVIGRGRVVAAGDKRDLLGGSSTRVRAADPARLGVALRAAGHGATVAADGLLTTDAVPETVARIAQVAGVLVTELGRGDGRDLETVFLDLTADDSREGALT